MVENKLNELEGKIANLLIKIGELEKSGKTGDMSGLEDLKKQLEELKNAHDKTVIKVNNNREDIEKILLRLDEITKNYKEGDETLQKEIDELNKKLAQINSQLELLLNLPRGEGKTDLSALNELMKRLIDLENKFNAFVERVNIDEIYRQLKFLDETKADKKAVEDSISDLNKKYNKHQEEIDAINKRIDNLFNQLLLKSKESGGEGINVDFSQYATKDEFKKHKLENDEEFKKIWDEIKKIKELIDKIFNILKDKANLSDLEDLKNFLMEKIDELALACNKKFPDKNDTTNNFKYLEAQLKKLFDLLSKKDPSNDGDNWLIAKKPINGYICAACESYIGDLRDESHKFIPWNKMPLRDPGDKLYRMGNGFSKMLQMLNFDNNGNVSLNPNIINEPTVNSNESKSRIPSAFPGQIQNNININNNINNINMNNNMNQNITKQKLKRIQSANPKMKMNAKEKLGKNSNFEIKNKNNYFPDIYDNNPGKTDDGPKITKIVRKPPSANIRNNDNGASQ